MGTPNNLAIFDSVLAVKDAKMDSLVHLVDLRSNRYIGKQCPRGQGPNEFNLIMSMEAEKDGKSLLLYDPNPCALYRLARGSEGSIGLQRVYKNEKMQEDMHWNIYPISGNRHLATGLYGEHQFCLLDSLGNIVDKFGEYPYRDEEERGLSGIIKSQVYQGDVTIAPSGKRFLSCTLCGDLISIYEYNEATGHFQPKKNMYTTFPEYKYQGDNYFGVSRECPLTHLDATSTDDYIYLLYSGKTTQDVGLTAFYGNRIFVLNWEGEKVGGREGGRAAMQARPGRPVPLARRKDNVCHCLQPRAGGDVFPVARPVRRALTGEENRMASAQFFILHSSFFI